MALGLSPTYTATTTDTRRARQTNRQAELKTSEQGNCDGRYVSKGATTFELKEEVEARDFHFLLLPEVTMLAFSAAVEPLRIANQLTERCLYRWHIISEDGAPVRCSNGVQITVDGGLTATNPGDSIFVCSGTDGYLAASSRTLSWLREQSRHGRSIGGVCTGAFSLARAGLLNDKRFTLHWESQPVFRERFPTLSPTNYIYCRDGQITTCGGGNACSDLFLGLIEEHYGSGLATKVAEMCLHGLPRGKDKKQRLSVAAEIGVRNPRLSAIVQDMRTSFSEEMCLDDLSVKHKLSRRQLERLFQKYLGTSPAAELRDIRVDHAHSLISETEMSMMAVAMACGFQSPGALRKAYRQRFGVSPSHRIRKQPERAAITVASLSVGEQHALDLEGNGEASSAE